MSQVYETHNQDNQDIVEFYNTVGNRNRFNVLYTLYSNVLKHHKLSNYHSFMVGDQELLGTLTMGLIACMKTVSHLNPYRGHLVIQYITNVITMLNTTEYSGNNYVSLKEWFVSLFSSEAETSMLNENGAHYVEIQNFNINDRYYEAQKKIDMVVNRPHKYHEEYINLLTLCYYPFLMVVRGMRAVKDSDKEVLLQNFIRHLNVIDKTKEEDHRTSKFDSPHNVTNEFIWYNE